MTPCITFRAFQCYQQAGQRTFTRKTLSETVIPPTPLAVRSGRVPAFLRLSQSAPKPFSSQFSAAGSIQTACEGALFLTHCLRAQWEGRWLCGSWIHLGHPSGHTAETSIASLYEPPEATPGHLPQSTGEGQPPCPMVLLLFLASLSRLAPPAWEERAVPALA